MVEYPNGRIADATYEIIRAKSGLDAFLGHAFPILDHGFIRVIDYMGNDEAITQMARVSYGAGTKAVNDDAGLIDYLMRHHHTSPFEGCEIKLHVKLPIFIARQWIRHRTANVNEYSARYSIMDNEFYVPEPEVMMRQSTTNKQGRAEVIDPELAGEIRQMLFRENEKAYQNYSEISDSDGDYGLARELARINLPVSIYTQWYWKVDLHNLLHFLRLRADPHAQYEIREYADCIKDIIGLWVPGAVAAAEEHIFGATTFSKTEMMVLHNLLASKSTGQIERVAEVFNMRPTRIKELLIKLGRL